MQKKLKEICDRYQVPLFTVIPTRKRPVKTGGQGPSGFPLPVFRGLWKHRGLDPKDNSGLFCPQCPGSPGGRNTGSGLCDRRAYLRHRLQERPAPRGLEFLEEICRSVSLPVYAIGGIRLDREQIEKTLAAGARGVCVMSGAMSL